MHPRHTPNTDSRTAAQVSRATTTADAVPAPKPYQRMSAVDEKTSPMVWANR